MADSIDNLLNSIFCHNWPIKKNELKLSTHTMNCLMCIFEHGSKRQRKAVSLYDNIILTKLKDNSEEPHGRYHVGLFSCPKSRGRFGRIQIIL